MTSSLITGERRWASARRGGMTVLGKVAVPKPINLPSQRLENHGLDPNVEIVPKGTLSWGNRPSSAGSNAWGTSALSPSTDGGSSSPSHLVGRPSSGGGTRPSTAGSDRAHDSNVSAWGSNSRPSSASGVLGSNHTSLTSLRPRSAETRPGSSHLSRFAESLPDGSGACGPTITPERTGVATSANDGFSLSSGDFPTLGSEKDESRRNTEPIDHGSQGRPGSSSGGVKSMADGTGMAHGDDVSRMTDVQCNSWRKDGPPYIEDGPRPNIERWHGEPHMYQNPNMGPPHYESWHGAPPGGGWFRGPPGPAPYGGPVPPGGFHMEPFYYRGQVPAPGLANSQPIPPPGALQLGHHPKNGDMYRPHMPDSYMRPGMAMRPGFYPGPVPYDGYYRPPMGFCNPNERDLQFMGMPTGPPVHSRHTNPNAPDSNNSHPRVHEGRGADFVDPGHPHDPRGNYKVLVKPNDGWNQNDEEKWAHRVTTSGPNREKGILSNASLRENSWGDEYRKDQDIHYGRSASVEEAPPKSFENNFRSTNPANVKLPGGVGHVDQVETNPALDNVASPRDHSLIQKIEGLNAKVRASGVRQDRPHKEEAIDKLQIVNSKAPVSANDANPDVVFERHPSGVLVPVTRDIDVVAINRSRESSVTAPPRGAVRGSQSRGYPHGKGRLSGQEADGWEKNSESHTVVETYSGSTTNDKVKEHRVVVQHLEVPKSNVEKSGDGESLMSGFDPSDTQRAKMREIAKQRAIQLQKEEEERIREQKAKALAKLEELNRRSAHQGTEISNPKEIILPNNTVPQKPDDNRNQPEPSPAANRGVVSSSGSYSTALVNERSAGKTVESAGISRHMASETKGSAAQDFVSLQNQLPKADATLDDAAGHRTAPQVREVSKQKRVGYKQRQNVPSEKNPSQDSIPVSRTDMLKDNKGASTNQEVTATCQVDSGASKDLVESLVTSDSPAPQKKRNNKSGKNKHKVEEPLTAVSSTVVLPKDSNVVQAIPDCVEQNANNLRVGSTSVVLSTDAKDALLPSENHSSLCREDAHGRVNNVWKPQHARKARHSQGNRSSEKTNSNDTVVWAPVRSHTKFELTDQTSQKAAEPLISSATGDNLSHNSPKTKRAEMERYVPKPVAKELAQQGSVNQSPSLPVDQAASDGTVGREKASQGSESVNKAGSTVEPKHVDGKHRHARAQGSWRQRVSAEPILSQTLQDTSSANSCKITQPPSGPPQMVSYVESVVRGTPSRPDEHSVKGPQGSISDGWDSADDPRSKSSATFTGVRDHFPSGRGKRPPFKGQKGGGNNQNTDHNNSNSGLADLQSPVEVNQTEKTMSLGDRSTSHWQPKSQGYVGHNQQGNRSSGSQNHIVEDSKALKRESVPGVGVRSRSQHGQHAAKNSFPASEDKVVDKTMPEVGHQENKRDKRTDPAKLHPQSPSDGPASEVEPSSFEVMDGRNEQRPSSGYRKSSNYSGRFNRGHESRGDWSTAPQENKHHHSAANRERQRQNSHYEYQPVGPYHSNESVPQTENQPGGPRFREKGQNHARRGRGGFYGRQS